MCRGQEVAFYKRAQIYVGDLWGAFQVSILSFCSASNIKAASRHQESADSTLDMLKVQFAY